MFLFFKNIENVTFERKKKKARCKSGPVKTEPTGPVTTPLLHVSDYPSVEEILTEKFS